MRRRVVEVNDHAARHCRGRTFCRRMPPDLCPKSNQRHAPQTSNHIRQRYLHTVYKRVRVGGVDRRGLTPSADNRRFTERALVSPVTV